MGAAVWIERKSPGVIEILLESLEKAALLKSASMPTACNIEGQSTVNRFYLDFNWFYILFEEQPDFNGC